MQVRGAGGGQWSPLLRLSAAGHLQGALHRRAVRSLSPAHYHVSVLSRPAAAVQCRAGMHRVSTMRSTPHEHAWCCACAQVCGGHAASGGRALRGGRAHAAGHGAACPGPLPFAVAPCPTQPACTAAARPLECRHKTPAHPWCTARQIVLIIAEQAGHRLVSRPMTDVPWLPFHTLGGRKVGSCAKHHNTGRRRSGQCWLFTDWEAGKWAVLVAVRLGAVCMRCAGAHHG
jgi:hypothetical protein